MTAREPEALADIDADAEIAPENNSRRRRPTWEASLWILSAFLVISGAVLLSQARTFGSFDMGLVPSSIEADPETGRIISCETDAGPCPRTLATDSLAYAFALPALGSGLTGLLLGIALRARRSQSRPRPARTPHSHTQTQPQPQSESESASGPPPHSEPEPEPQRHPHPASHPHPGSQPQLPSRTITPQEAPAQPGPRPRSHAAHVTPRPTPSVRNETTDSFARFRPPVQQPGEDAPPR